jgi:hypothetical protein
MIKEIQKKGQELADSGIFVGGPPELFAEVGRNQLITSLANGLTPKSKVIEIGCCVLRGGYWLIHFLNHGNYCGIEPNERSVAAGIERVLDKADMEIFGPRFAFNSDFDLSPFDEKFDFFIGRSVWTHCSRAQIEQSLESFNLHGADGAKMIMSIKWSEKPDPGYLGNCWSPPVITHKRDWLSSACSKRGLELSDARDPLPVMCAQHWVKVTRA